MVAFYMNEGGESYINATCSIICDLGYGDGTLIKSVHKIVFHVVLPYSIDPEDYDCGI